MKTFIHTNFQLFRYIVSISIIKFQFQRELKHMCIEGLLGWWLATGPVADVLSISENTVARRKYCSYDIQAMFRFKVWIQTSVIFHHINLSYTHNFSVIYTASIACCRRQLFDPTIHSLNSVLQKAALQGSQGELLRAHELHVDLLCITI